MMAITAFGALIVAHNIGTICGIAILVPWMSLVIVKGLSKAKKDNQ